MSEFLHHNGHIIPTTEWHLSPDNRSFRYGDGFFETMKLLDGKIVLQELHFERLFISLEKLKFTRPEYLAPGYLQQAIYELVNKLGIADRARVRLTVYRGSGGPFDLQDHSPNLLIQAWPLSAIANEFEPNGLSMGIYTDARKTTDLFSVIKSNNYQCYLMAALWAKERGLDDALVLNAHDRLADATIANVFVVKDGTIVTPALTEGCIGGVMRRYILSALRKEGIPVVEGMINPAELSHVSEIFLTNAMIGIKWVRNIEENTFKDNMAHYLYNKFIKNHLW